MSYQTAPRGEAHYKSRAKEDDVKIIRELWAERLRLLEEANKLTLDKIANKMELPRSTVWNIINYNTWRHVS